VSSLQRATFLLFPKVISCSNSTNKHANTLF
jgi:hypothetical protein